TPASGFVLPWQGLIIGIVAGGVCFWACTVLKLRFKYDDSLDVFGVHGVGGATGTLLCGVFAAASVSISAATPDGLPGLLEGHPAQLLTQLYGVLATAVWCGVATFLLLRFVGLVFPLRASAEDEVVGLDISLHGEALQ